VGPAAKSLGLTDSPDPDPTKPYLMWANTPYAHAMIPVSAGAAHSMSSMKSEGKGEMKGDMDALKCGKKEDWVVEIKPHPSQTSKGGAISRQPGVQFLASIVALVNGSHCYQSACTFIGLGASLSASSTYIESTWLPRLIIFDCALLRNSPTI